VTIGKTAGKITLMDVRKSWSRKIPTHLFNATEYPDIDDDLIDKPVPLLFGAKTVPAYCTNGNIKTGDAEFRVAEKLTSISNVFVSVDDVWEIVIPTSVSLENGEFILSEKDSRGIEDKGNWDPVTNTPELSDETGTNGQFYLCTATGDRDLGSGTKTFTSGEYVYYQSTMWVAKTDRPEKKARDTKVEAVGTLDSGESFASPLGVLKWIEEKYNNAAFTDSFFDTAEITSEIGSLQPISVYTFDKQIEISELVRQMQEGSSNRFRYEISPSGKRTARLDNLDREPIMFVGKEEILENDKMELYTDKSTIAATIKINWGQDGVSGEYKTVVDTSREGTVAQNARERPELEFNTFLYSRAHAVSRAALEATRLGQIRRFTDCTLRGVRFLTLRIYDMITVELVSETEDWAGIWNCQVLSIAPDTDNEQNKVTLLLVEQQVDEFENRIIKIGDDGSIKVGENEIIKEGL
jgi:hypothetical protein